MTIMLPTATPYAGSLTEVLPSCLSAIGVQGQSNSLLVPESSSVVLVLVDGLGEYNLMNAPGHARFLIREAQSHTVLRTVFPSTTSAALVSLMSGANPGEHGVVGYRIRDPHSKVVVNQLTDLDSLGPAWVRRPTLATTVSEAARVVVVGKSKFLNSAMTRVAYDGAEYVCAESVSERFARANDLARVPGRVVLVYVSELDTLAHRHGVSSVKWTEALEALDQDIRLAREQLPRDISLVLTADHGVVDAGGQRILLSDPSLFHAVSAVGGEPRCLQLYLSDSADNALTGRVAREWQAVLGDSAEVALLHEVVDAGVFPDLDPVVRSRLGDVFVFAADGVALFDDREPNKSPQRMIGQHGALSDAEMSIPFLVA